MVPASETESPPAAAKVAWSPEAYLRFEDERTRPARDLLAQVRLEAPRRIVDVGCGPGNSTELLATRWPEAEVTGLDSSETMLEAARKRLPAARFIAADATTWLPEPGTDLVFANAVYQWIPEHLPLLPWIVESLAPGGTLAVQMPDNLQQPSHVLMRDVAQRMPFADKLEGAARVPLPPVAAYYDALAGSARRLDIWHTIYNHVLPDAASVVEWVKSTGLNPFLQRLDAGEQEEFLAAYAEAIAQAYPPAEDGNVLLAFPRLFIVAER
jgi:trans-aconitate 2-methyltransferase